MPSFSIHEKSKTVVVGDWRSKATWIHDGDTGLKALVALQPGMNVSISTRHNEADEVHLALWVSEPDSSDGIGVVEKDDKLVAWKRIPLCTCGNRACGNANSQLSMSFEIPYASDLLKSLEVLPYAGTRQPHEEFWLGPYHRKVSQGTDPTFGWVPIFPVGIGGCTEDEF